MFLTTTLLPNPAVAQNVFNLPLPGTPVTLSPPFTPPLVRGITIYPDNHLKFDFIVDVGDEHLQGDAFQEESMKLIKYFLVSLTVPENDMWVNLSPHESDRIVPEQFGMTEMGRDLLLQDYMLKQLTASLMNPQQELGAEFWQRVREKAREQFGTEDVPTDTFNKVWIIPDKAQVYVKGNSVFVVDSHLKVMLEEDYLTMMKEKNSAQSSEFRVQSSVAPLRSGSGAASRSGQNDLLSTDIIREIIIPAIEQEVNEGKNFALLRQIQNSAILAAWYKKNLKQSLLGKVYVDQKKTDGVSSDDKDAAQSIYDQYLAAFKIGVYDFIKEEYDPASQEVIPRKYFSGGFVQRAEQELVEVPGLSSGDLVLLSDRTVSEITVTLSNSTDQPMQDAAMLVNTYDSIKTMYQDLPQDIQRLVINLAPKINQGEEIVRNQQSIMDLMVNVGKIFEQAMPGLLSGDGLTPKNYHNQMHNLAVSMGSLILAQNAGLIKDKNDLVVTFLGALFHDFHVREVRPLGEKSATPALVSETLGVEGANIGGQLPDLLGIRGYIYQNPAIANARYGKVSSVLKDTISKSYLALVGNENADEIYDEIAAVVSRTDFPSDLPPAINKYKNRTIMVREFIDTTLNDWTKEKTELITVDLEKLIADVERQYQDIYSDMARDKELAPAGKREVSENWVTRQRNIERTFLKALTKVKPARRLQVYQIAESVEVVDQSVATWIGTPEATKEITLGLKEELPFVSIEANYAMFYVPQLLPSRILSRLKELPLNAKINFVQNIGYFANYSTDFAKSLGEEKKSQMNDYIYKLMLNSLGEWHTIEEDVLMELGLYEDENGKIKEQKANRAMVQGLRKSIIGTAFNLREIHSMVVQRTVRRLNFSANQTIVEEGDVIDPQKSDGLYIIVSGEAKVIKGGSTVATLRAGDHFGELALISRLPRNATVVSSSNPTVLLKMPSRFLHGLRLINEEFSDSLYAGARARTRKGTAILPNWVESEIVMKMNRSDQKLDERPDILSWQTPQFVYGKEKRVERLTPQIIWETLPAVLYEIENEYPQMEKVKMVAISANGPSISFYADPIDRKTIIVFSGDFFRGDLENFSQRIKDAWYRQVTDAAMMAVEAPGGIDLNSNEQALEELGDKIEFSMPSDISQWQDFQTNGFIPVINNITPPISLPLLLGAATPASASEPINVSSLY